METRLASLENTKEFSSTRTGSGCRGRWDEEKENQNPDFDMGKISNAK
jgi:hypothetical protein